MMNSKRIKALLLLGVMLLGLVISGCAPEQPTGTKETKPGLNTVPFHALVSVDDVEKISIYEPVSSTFRAVTEDDKIDSFIALYLKDMPFTDDAAEVDFISRRVAAEVIAQMSISFTYKNSDRISININPEGYAILTMGEAIFVLPRSERLDYVAIGKYH